MAKNLHMSGAQVQRSNMIQRNFDPLDGSANERLKKIEADKKGLIGILASSEIISWFADTDIRTIEKLLVTLQWVLIGCIWVRGNGLVSQPPPYFQGGYALVLPYQVWIVGLLLATGWQTVASTLNHNCQRLIGACIAILFTCPLNGPLYLTGQVLTVITLVMTFWQAVLVARLANICNKV